MVARRRPYRLVDYVASTVSSHNSCTAVAVVLTELVSVVWAIAVVLTELITMMASTMIASSYLLT